MGFTRALTVALGVAVALLALPSEAKNCKKGKPCGNSCIAWNKTCHIGTSYTAPKTSGTSKKSSSSSSSIPTRKYHYEPQPRLPIDCPKGTTFKGAYPPDGFEVWCENGKGTRIGPWVGWLQDRKGFWLEGAYDKKGNLKNVICIDGGFETACPDPTVAR